MTRTAKILAYLGGVFLLAAAVIFVDIPERTRFWQELFTAGHTLVFGLCALACLRLSSMILGRHIRFRLSHYLIAFALAIAVGAATEIIQPYFGRDGELADLYRDILGAAAFLFAAMTFDHQLTWEFRAGRWMRYLVRTAAPILIVLIFWPAIKWGGAYIYRDRQMPLLGSFDSRILRQFMRVSNGKLTVMDPPPTWSSMNGKVGRVTFYPSIYPGIMLRELSPDWSAYKELRFDIFSELPGTVPLELRINDRHHNEKYNDRYNASLKVRPGENQVVVSLERLRKAPAHRSMDLTDMGTIILFAYKPVDSFSIYLSDFRLQ